MIFSNKVYKLPSGKNISFFCKDESNLEMYVANGIVYKNIIKPKENFRSINSGRLFYFNMVSKLNSNHLGVCFDKNISVTAND